MNIVKNEFVEWIGAVVELQTGDLRVVSLSLTTVSIH